MEIPQVGYSSPRDIQQVTTPKVLERFELASSTNIAEVYLLSHTNWRDTDGHVNEADMTVKQKIEDYLDKDPKAKFFIGIDLATKVSDTVTTWGNFDPEIDPELNKTIMDWIAEGIISNDEEMTTLDVAIVSEMISGRIAVGDSFLTLKDLQYLKDKIEDKVAGYLDKNDDLKKSWEKIINDLKVGEMMGV